ncbi:CdiA C-terminal domain-containing protein [Actinoalloteichus hymeniacidonis]|nr:hypothetical protein [Actinoalloteichus hymeniacidonis]MBB5906521.1 hypothetical protein [Actinoalloteichus hymeniacidonis]
MTGFDRVATSLRHVKSETESAAAELSGIDRELGELLTRLDGVARGSTAAEMADVPKLIEQARVEIDNARTRYRNTAGRIHAYLAEHGHSPTSGTTALVGAREPTPRSAESARHNETIPLPNITPPHQPAGTVTDDPATWPGRIREPTGDEAFSPEEQSVAERLARLDEVEIVIQPPGSHRTPDAVIDGVGVEFKTLTDPNPDAERVKNTLNRSVRKGGQGTEIIIDGRRTTLTEADAIRGTFRFLRAPGNARKLARIRIWGADFDFEWKRGS